MFREMKERHGPLPILMLVLTVVTGLVDAFSYLALGHVFVANMTGNVVFSGFAIAGAAGFSLAASLTALGAFAVGALLGGRIAHRAHAHRARVLHLTLVLETILFVAAYVLAQTAGTSSNGVRYPLIVLLGLAMGVQNASARALAVPDLTTTVLTLTITGIASDSRLAGGPNSRIARRAMAVGSMFLGALIGALAILHGNHPALPLLLAALLLAAVTAAAFALTRSDRPWVRPT